MEVGDYVRTKYGITQYKEYETTNGNKILCMPVKDGSNGIFANIEDVIKSSPNIIDLIEVGDLVNYEQLNGGYVLNKRENEIDTWAILPNSLKNEDIKSVITREQLIEMQYKIESEVN